jgi:hypothetical protein
MSTRYWVKTDLDRNPLTLFRLVLDDTAKSIAEQEWHGEWQDTDRLVLALTKMEWEYEEIGEETARSLFPDAFTSPAEKAVGMSLVTKAANERRYTLGPMYVPNRIDAHGEWTDPEELQNAVWGYVRKGDRRIRLQHNRDVVAGEFVEVLTWPYEVTVPMMKETGMSETTFPKDTVFLGVVWEPWAWELVKAGKLRGYSVGGRAQRLEVDLPAEGVQKEAVAGGGEGSIPSGPTVETVHEDTIMGTAPKRRKKTKDK